MNLRTWPIHLSMLVLGVLVAGSAWAQFSCQKVKLSKRINVQQGKNLFLLDHPQISQYDTLASSFVGLFNTYQILSSPSLRDHVQSVFLVENDQPTDAFLPTCQPDSFIASEGGEITINGDAPSVIFAGGYFSACQRQTVQEVLKTWTSSHYKYRRMFFPLDAIYDFPEAYDGKDKTLQPYYGDYLQYQKISGTYRMNEYQVMRLMGKDQFLKRTKNYFMDMIQVTGNVNSQLHFPPGSQINLHVLYRGGKDDNFSIEHHETLAPGPEDKKIDIFLVDEGWLLGILQKTPTIW